MVNILDERCTSWCEVTMADSSEFSFGFPEDGDLDTCADLFKKATGAKTSPKV